MLCCRGGMSRGRLSAGSSAEGQPHLVSYTMHSKSTSDLITSDTLSFRYSTVTVRTAMVVILDYIIMTPWSSTESS